MKAAIYTRISKDLRGSAGIQRQEQTCRDLCGLKGWEVVETYTDNDISAFSGKPRPGYRDMLKDIKAGGIDVVVAWHTDRIYRRIADLAEFIEACREGNTEVATVEGGSLDLSTATGRMIAGILGSVAAGEVDHQIERQRAAHADRAARGRYRGGPVTFGFRTVPGKPGHLEHDEPKAEALRKAADDVLAGKSLRSIAVEWVESGIAVEGKEMPYGAAKVRKRLSSPRIAGLEPYKGELYPATTYEAIISESKWRAVMDVLSRNGDNNNRGQERKHLGTGIYRCGECGGTFHSIKRSGEDESRRRYACKKCTRVSRKMAPVDELVTEVVIGYLSSQRLELARKDNTKGVDLQALRDEQAGLIARANEVGVMFTRGEVTAEQFRAMNAELTKMTADVERKIRQATKASPLASVLLSEGGVRAAWERLNPLQRSKIVDELVTVTINKTEMRGGFDPEAIDIQFK